MMPSKMIDSTYAATSASKRSCSLVEKTQPQFHGTLSSLQLLNSFDEQNHHAKTSSRSFRYASDIIDEALNVTFDDNTTCYETQKLELLLDNSHAFQAMFKEGGCNYVDDDTLSTCSSTDYEEQDVDDSDGEAEEEQHALCQSQRRELLLDNMGAFESMMAAYRRGDVEDDLLSDEEDEEEEENEFV